MPRLVKKPVPDGTWLVLVPGAVAYLRYKGARDPKSPTAIYDLLKELGFLDDMDRSRQSILATIRKRLGKQYEGLVQE